MPWREKGVNRAGVSRVQQAVPCSEDSDPMTTIVIPAAIAVAGVYLRWAIGPVLAAYQVGRHMERMLTTMNRGATGLDPASRQDR